MLKNRSSTFSLLEPSDILALYYTSLYSGDLSTVKELMTTESYSMTLETFGLRLSLRDQEFKALLKNIKEDEDALAVVETKLSYDLIARKNSPEIDIKSVSWNGEKRQTIDYTEDGKIKKLYFSKEKDGWKINYYAGRKVN
ncbi:hypothetical protein MN086_05850 [Sulfurovum sp. XGS-02]|uniref:hypothetical protein n=1 Tax=Sulfurovum sp. XGS-02 TaxID=2925411 RepID=UPI00206AB2EA|nr:hypothetical protein [Sulfurovum sp. XGS-02]UPT76576.1 hypothetical protein MN086_05850 [Sulfurovum sp. XGS-02]